MNSIECTDAFYFLSCIQDESVDMILTDPPYASLEKHRKKGTTTRLKKSKGSSNEWFDILANEQLPLIMKEFYRVLKKNTHCYMFCDQETMFLLKDFGEKAGFTFHKPLIWNKVILGMGYHYRAQYEVIMFFEKGKRKLNDFSVPDVFNSFYTYTDTGIKNIELPEVLFCSRLNPKRSYPAEKPINLLSALVIQSTKENELILDPFCGSGSTGIASAISGRSFLCCDKSKKMVRIASQRIADIELAKKPKQQ